MIINNTTKRKVLYILAIATAMALHACGSKKEIQEGKQSPVSVSKTTSHLSHFARQFTSTLQAEIKQENTSIEQFKPSAKLIETFGLVKKENDFFVVGLATLSASFSNADFDVLQIQLGRPMNTKHTIRIPLKNYFKFLDIESLQYFEMNPKLEQK